jgi:hypothetical protein
MKAVWEMLVMLGLMHVMMITYWCQWMMRIRWKQRHLHHLFHKLPTMMLPKMMSMMLPKMMLPKMLPKTLLTMLLQILMMSEVKLLCKTRVCAALLVFGLDLLVMLMNFLGELQQLGFGR